MKSYVGMTYTVCPLCGERDHDGLLIDATLKDSLERENFTGYKLCEKCLKPGYIPVIAVKDDHFTGEVMYVRENKVEEFFNTSIPGCGFAFCEPDLIEMCRRVAE